MGEGVFELIGSPPVFAFIGSAVALLSGLVAVRMSRSDSPADRYFVLMVATLTAGLILLLGFVTVPVARAIAHADRALSPGTHSVILPELARPDAPLWLGAVALGMALVLWRRLGGTFVVGGVIYRSERAPASLRDVLYDCREDLGVDDQVELRVSDEVSGPFVTGVLDPVVVVPRGLLEQSRESQKHVLRHELAHLARRDTLTQLATQLAGTLLWWNPLYWAVSRELTLLRELACDDAATFGNVDRAAYSELLREYACRRRWSDSLGFSQIRMAAAATLDYRLDVLANAEPLSTTLLAFVPNYASRTDVVATCAVYAVIFGACDVFMFTLEYEEPAANRGSWMTTMETGSAGGDVLELRV